MKIKSVNKIKDHFGNYQLSLNCYSDKIINALGMPERVNYSSKTDWSWIVQMTNGVTVEIYDWKIGKNYLNANGCDLDEIWIWSVNSHSKSAASLVSKFILEENWNSFDDIRKQIFCTKDFIESNYVETC